MNKIIAPVDFSAISLNAATYAAHMAAALNKDLELLHVVQIPVVYGDVPMPVGEFEVAQAEATDALEKLANELDEKLAGQVIIHRKVKVGSPVYELVQLSSHKGVFAIVMGTRGVGAAERFFLGSTTSSLVADSECPILVVPQDFHFSIPKKIGFATDMKDVVNSTPQKTIADFAAAFDAKLEILHANPDYSEYEPSTMEQGLMLDTLFEHQKHSFHFLHSGYTEESILKYAADNNLQLLIIVSKDHGWLNTLFQHQHTGTFIRQASIPVMVLKQSHQ